MVLSQASNVPIDAIGQKYDYNSVIYSTTLISNPSFVFFFFLSTSYNCRGSLVSDGALIQRQKDMMGLQDGMILEIGQGVDRIHNQVIILLYMRFEYI